MTDEQYEAAINANAARAAISRAHGDEISGDYWWEQAQLLSDQREAARARTLSDAEHAHIHSDTFTDAMAARLNASIGRLDARDHCDTFDVLKGSPDHSTLSHD